MTVGKGMSLFLAMAELERTAQPKNLIPHRETLRHVALGVRGIKSWIVHCFASQPRQSTASGNLYAVRD